MSYDVSVTCPTCQSDVLDRGNMTSNVSGMWKKAGANLRDWDGKVGVDVLPELQRAIEWMTNDPEDFRALEPENGWGDLPGCLRFLEGIRNAIARCPNAKLSVSY